MQHLPSLTLEFILETEPPRYKPVLKHVENRMRLLPQEMPFRSQTDLDTMLQDEILPVWKLLDPLSGSEHAFPAATWRRCLNHNRFQDGHYLPATATWRGPDRPTYDSSNCPLCRQHTATDTHVLFQCLWVKRLYEHVPNTQPPDSWQALRVPFYAQENNFQRTAWHLQQARFHHSVHLLLVHYRWHEAAALEAGDPRPGEFVQCWLSGKDPPRSFQAFCEQRPQASRPETP